MFKKCHNIIVFLIFLNYSFIIYDGEIAGHSGNMFMFMYISQ